METVESEPLPDMAMGQKCGDPKMACPGKWKRLIPCGPIPGGFILTHTWHPPRVGIPRPGSALGWEEDPHLRQHLGLQSVAEGQTSARARWGGEHLPRFLAWNPHQKKCRKTSIGWRIPCWGDPTFWVSEQFVEYPRIGVKDVPGYLLNQPEKGALTNTRPLAGFSCCYEWTQLEERVNES